MQYDTLCQLAQDRHLSVLGGFAPAPGDALPAGTATVILLGPAEPGFWPAFRRSPEALDGAPDPMDRWSRRVIGRLACDLGGKAMFPFGGPPHHPFMPWAIRSGRAWASPVHLLVHDRAGLMVSYRGALALKTRLELPAPPKAPPCAECAQPCLTGCPVGALGHAGYDTALCHAHLDNAAGLDCMARGCALRRACPVSAGHDRHPEQSAFHMQSFHPCP